MPVSLLYSALFATAEFTLRRLLNLDPLLKNDLAQLGDTVLAVHCSAPQVDCFLVIHGNGADKDPEIRLTQAWDGAIDASLGGNALSLASLLTGSKDSLQNSKVKVSGDMAKAQRLQSILSAANIDWEYHLSRLFGDVPTQTASNAAQKGMQQAKSSIDSLAQDLDEYLHEEKRLLPGEIEVEEFYRRIDELKLRADRLAARIKQLAPSSVR